MGFARRTAQPQLTLMDAFPKLIAEIDQAHSLGVVMSVVVRSSIFCSGKFGHCLQVY